MSFLSFFGIRAPQPGDDSIADLALRAALDGAAYAHGTLREALRTDPVFGSVICRALGCQDPECKAPLPTLERRTDQIPPVIDTLSEGEAPVLPQQKDLRE